MKQKFFMKNRNDLIALWMQIANDDFLVAKELLNSDNIFPRSICFHLQQSAEKFFKAYLVYFDLDIIKTHDLTTLINKLSNADGEVIKFIEAATVLTPYAISVRYPDDFELISDEELKEAYKLAEEIKNYIQSKIIL